VLRSIKQQQSSKETAAWAKRQKKLRSTVHYVVAAAVLTVGMSYAAVPLYRMFCQVCLISLNVRIRYDSPTRFNEI
jgi:cytochrome c oxidase assembly protein Cox11